MNAKDTTTADKRRIIKLEEDLEKLGNDSRDTFAYIMRRCEAVQRTHGLSIETPEARVFVVAFEQRNFTTRVEALEFAERLTRMLDKL